MSLYAFFKCPKSAFIMLDLLDPWFKDQLEKKLLSKILSLYL